jgi:transmembrane sensor
VALGTKFAVRRDSGGVRVIVSEGRVRIERAGARQVVQSPPLARGAMAQTAGEEILVAHAGAASVSEALAWRRGYLVFRETTLGAAAADFNRYNRIQLVVADPDVAAIPIGGRFRAGNVEAFVRLIEQGFPVRAERRDETIVLRRR